MSFLEQSLLNSYGLSMQKICWEDNARNKKSSIGPNISDWTLRSNGKDCDVIRRPNLADITVDHSMNNFYVTVGNEDGTTLRRIPLSEYLDKLSIEYNSSEDILCSTQACILESSSGLGDVSFNTRVFNYQTTAENPAVLVIISSNQGTSSQILDNHTTDVLFNNKGRAFDFLAERLKEERIRLNKPVDEPMSADEKERNVIFMYQVPLVVPVTRATNVYANDFFGGYMLGSASTNTLGGFVPKSFGYAGGFGSAFSSVTKSCGLAPMTNGTACGFGSVSPTIRFDGQSLSESIVKKGFDHAMLRVSSNDKGEFKGTRGKTLTRDMRFPIRCTLQYYYLTDSMDLTEPLVKSISEQLKKFYSNSKNESSLVMGDTGRTTEFKKCDPLENPSFQISMNSYA